MNTEILIGLAVIICILLCVRVGYVKNVFGNPIGSAVTIGKRELQQDAVGSALGYDSYLMVIADGMGNGPGGKIASKIAVDTFLDLYADYQSTERPQYYFRRAFNLANHKILETLDLAAGSASAAVAMIRGGFLYYALVGSVKVAVFRGGDLIPVSEGQTIDILARKRYAEGRISKETAISLLDEQRLYNVLGQDTFNDIEFFSKPLELRRGDMVVLMTDGVTYALKWLEIENCLRNKKSPQDMAKSVIDAVERCDKADLDNAAIIIYQN